MLDLKLFAIHTKSYLEKLFAIFIIFYEEDDTSKGKRTQTGGRDMMTNDPLKSTDDEFRNEAGTNTAN